MATNVPLFVVFMLMVCCLVLGFLAYGLFMEPPPANVLNCPKANVSVECPKPDIHFECPEFPEIPKCPDCDCDDGVSYMIEEYTYTSHLQRVISSTYLERNHAGVEKWDCDDMAEETAKRINNAYEDILNCKVRYGYYYLENNSSLKEGHAWVECKTKSGLIIESTNGKIIPPEEYEWYRQW